jgi:hypothetical protein
VSDAFEAPEKDPYLGMSTDGLLVVAMGLLIAAAGFCGMFLVITGVGTVMSPFLPQEPGEPPMWVIAPLEFLFFLVPTALYGLAAVGVWRRAKWGWVLALLGFGVWMGGCCLPFALVGFYALLREDGRKAFGFGT